MSNSRQVHRWIVINVFCWIWIICMVLMFAGNRVREVAVQRIERSLYSPFSDNQRLILQLNDDRNRTAVESEIYRIITSNTNKTRDSYEARRVEKTEYCTTKAKYQSTWMSTMFLEWDRFAKSIGLTYMLFYGSLLGQYRTESIIPYDHDTDVAILNWDTEKLDPYRFWNKTINPKNYYYTAVSSYWRNIYPRTRNISKDFPWKEPNARFCIKEGGYWVDIWGLLPNPANSTVLRFQDKYAKWNLTDIPLSAIYPLRKCTFENITVNCPNDPVRVLHQIYGDTLSPAKICVKGRWQIALRRTSKSREW